MKPLRTKLLESQRLLHLPWEVLERDYLLSWILAGIAQVEELKETLVFKGGTCLKKCYFKDYRFSEDLDFTAIGYFLTGKEMHSAMQRACNHAIKLIDPYAPVEIICESYQPSKPHPRGQEAFNIRAKFPWHRKPQTNIMVEITIDEEILKPVILKPILHEYDELFEANILVYSLEEIIAEKLRAILQNIKNLETRGWARSRARDYYDLWCILNTYRDQLEIEDFRVLLHKKCLIRGVNFENCNSFFSPKLLAIVEQTWQQWLGPLVSELPPYHLVIDELQHQVSLLLVPLK